MSDDETKKDSVDEPQDEAPEDSGSDAPAVEEPSAEETPAAPEAESDDAPAAEQEAEAPAAEEASAEEAPVAEEASDDAPAAEEAPAAPAAEPDPEDELPWKERRRLQRSRRPHKAGDALSVEERAAQRAKIRKGKAAERRKERAGAKEKKGTPGTGTPVAEREANAAKVRQGIVVSNKGNKSITVRIDFARRHPTYEKIVRRSRTLHAHDERNEAGEGDVVRVVETRPLSKTKRWRLVDVVEKAR
jgi:small subunit ribosomal protein S17